MALEGVMRPGHAQVRVLELDKAVTFYRDVMGLVETGRDASGRVYFKCWDGRFAMNGAAPVSMLTQFITDWSVEGRKWVDSVIKVAASESAENAATIAGWVSDWSTRAMAALLPPVEQAIGSDADALLGQVLADLTARLAKAGVKA